jgi:hypothetical protein
MMFGVETALSRGPTAPSLYITVAPATPRPPSLPSIYTFTPPLPPSLLYPLYTTHRYCLVSTPTCYSDFNMAAATASVLVCFREHYPVGA